MKSFKQYLEEAGKQNWARDQAFRDSHKATVSAPVSGRKFVKNGITITFHDDKVEYHSGGDLLHSKSGDYKNLTKSHIHGATSVSTALHKKLYGKT
jgi:hypothetical protein